MLPPIPVPPNFRIIAHRGASAYAPENTLAAFNLALEMGITEIETDAQLTPDGEVVLCHDSTLERYGLGDEFVEYLPWKDLADFDFGAWFSPHLFAGERMITLDTLLHTYQTQFTYHIELKGRAPNLPKRVHETIQAHKLAAQCIITSFSYEMLVRMHQIEPTYRLGWLIRDPNETVFKQAQQLHLFQLCPLAEQVDADFVKQARQFVPEVRAWGMRGQPNAVRKLIARVADAGCDGMTIDWPDWAVNDRLLVG